jgi:hypothetical protein
MQGRGIYAGRHPVLDDDPPATMTSRTCRAVSPNSKWPARLSELNRLGGSYPRTTRCLGLTQAKLAELVGGTRNSIARWERGELGKIVVVQ